MREILFRGKRCDNGEWAYSRCPDGTLHSGVVKYDFIPETVGQFTGVCGKNGMIFEGDILKFSYTGKNKGVEGTESVVFKNGKFGVEWGWHRELVALDGFANTMIEVIGNIHDNPELLGGADNAKVN